MPLETEPDVDDPAASESANTARRVERDDQGS